MSREKFNRMNKAAVQWDDLTDDIEHLVEEYEQENWETLVLHPGDVAATSGEATEGNAGFRLVVPESELEALTEAVEGAEETYDEFEVHRALAKDILLFVVVVKSRERDRAVIFPTYYDPEVDREFVEAVREQETIHTEIANLDRSRRFSFRHDDPTLFLQ